MNSSFAIDVSIAHKPMEFLFQGYVIRFINCAEVPLACVARDICDALNIKNRYAIISKLDEDEKIKVKLITERGSQLTWIVSEPGLYKLILRSNTRQSQPFKRWLCHQVIPSLRPNNPSALNSNSAPNNFLRSSVAEETVIDHHLLNQIEDLKKDIEELKQRNDKLEKEKFVAKYQLEDMVAKLILMDNSFTQKELQWEREKRELERYKVLYQKTHTENSWLKDQHNHTNNLTDSLSQSINELSKKKGFRRFQEDN